MFTTGIELIEIESLIGTEHTTEELLTDKDGSIDVLLMPTETTEDMLHP